MSAVEQNVLSRNRADSPLAYLLVFVFVLFIGILMMVYFITRQSHPVMLDEHGKPVASSLLLPIGQKDGTVRL